jgi:hypothetical protein
LFEQTIAQREVGAGIQISPNASRFRHQVLFSFNGGRIGSLDILESPGAGSFAAFCNATLKHF